VLVADLTTGTIVARFPIKPQEVGTIRYLTEPTFIPGTKELLLDSYNLRTEKREFQIWRIPPGDRPERTFPGRLLGRVRMFSANQTVASCDYDDPPSVKVVDLRDGKELFSYSPAADQEPFERKQSDEPIISADGRTVVRPAAGAVWDVETGKRLRSWVEEREHIRTDDLFSLAYYGRGNVDPRGRVEYYENVANTPWAKSWNSWVATSLPKFTIEGGVFAVYDLRTGALLYRCIRSSIPNYSGANTISSAEDLLVEKDGSVFDMPPRVRWWLLIAIQGTLALPLVAVWVIRRFVARKTSRRSA
jgi:hypothetical protein